MATTLGRRTWLALLALYGAAAVLLYVFTSVQVAPCLAGSGTAPAIQEACAAAWFANRPLADQLLASPIPAIALFAVLVALTAWRTRIRAAGRQAA